MSWKSSTNRYGATAIAIHWISALAVIGLLISGTIADGTAPAAKGTIVPMHAAIGTLVLVLTLVRIGWWVWFDRHPEAVPGQSRAMDVAAKAVHGLLYLVLIVLVVSGVATIALSDALPALLSGAALPDFSTVAPRAVHGIASKLMIALVLLHTLAALYHQFVKRDRLLGRMGVGPV